MLKIRTTNLKKQPILSLNWHLLTRNYTNKIEIPFVFLKIWKRVQCHSLSLFWTTSRSPFRTTILPPTRSVHLFLHSHVLVPWLLSFMFMSTLSGPIFKAFVFRPSLVSSFSQFLMLSEVPKFILVSVWFWLGYSLSFFCLRLRSRTRPVNYCSLKVIRACQLKF